MCIFIKKKSPYIFMYLCQVKTDPNTEGRFKEIFTQNFQFSIFWTTETIDISQNIFFCLKRFWEMSMVTKTVWLPTFFRI